MEVDEDPGFVPNDEVDELRWLPMAEAARAAHHDDERDRAAAGRRSKEQRERAQETARALA